MAVMWDETMKGSGVTLSNNNLTANIQQRNSVIATEGKVSGKWYWEITCDSGSGNMYGIGIANKNLNLNDAWGNGDSGYYYGVNGYIYGITSTSSSGSSYGSSYSNGDIIGVLLDMDSRKVNFSKNGVWQGEVGHIITGEELYPYIARGTTSGNVTMTANFGNSPFTYPMPEGYKPYDSVNKILIQSSFGDVFSVIDISDTKDLVPKMDGYTKNGITITASSELDGDRTAWKPFSDKNESHFDSWSSISGEENPWLQISFSNAISVGGYTVSSRHPAINGSLYPPKDWILKASNSGDFTGEEVVLDSQTNQTNWSIAEKREFVVKNTNSFKYYRFYFSNSETYVMIGEMELFGLNIIKKINSQTEQDFINHGMDESTIIDPQVEMTQMQYINNVSTPLGSGKVFEQPIDDVIKSLKVK